MNLKRYFDRVVLIHLQRRPERLIRIREELKRCKWPFKQPEIFTAVDGLALPHPESWQHEPGAWGCMRSHQRVLENAMIDGVNQILVLEDDVCFVENFKDAVEEFLAAVPDDWDQLMIGGEHQDVNGPPQLVKPGIYRCTSCGRTHCYAIRGSYMSKLYLRWIGGGEYDGNVHCDWIMARDPEMQLAHKVYAPEFFLAGQERNISDISGTLGDYILPRKFWNPPAPNLSVVNLHAPPAVVDALREHGFCTGKGCGGQGHFESKLHRVFEATKDNPMARIEMLRRWITALQWELASDPFLFCTVAHPQANPELVRAASLWPVFEITGTSVEQAVAQLPAKLRRRKHLLTGQV